MEHLEIDFTLPIVLLVGALIGVVVVRQLIALGDRRAKVKTRRLLDAHPASESEPTAPLDEDGARRSVAATSPSKGNAGADDGMGHPIEES